MISSLKEVVAPLSNPEFLDILRKRKLTFRRSSGENRFNGLLNWEMLRSAVESGTIPVGKYLVTKKARPVPSIFYEENGKVDKIRFSNLFNRGASLVSDRLDRYIPTLGALCDDVRAHVPERISGGAIVTTGSGGALLPHFDEEDIMVFQIEGSKRWMIYGQPVVNPVKGMLEPSQPQNAPVFDEVLRPGDFVFVPGGYWHQCENGSDLSLHGTILITPPCGLDAVQALMPQLLADEVFREPLLRFRSETEMAAHEIALKAFLIEKIKQVSFAELLLSGLTKEPREQEYLWRKYFARAP